jgi:hypothetical protein
MQMTLYSFIKKSIPAKFAIGEAIRVLQPANRIYDQADHVQD